MPPPPSSVSGDPRGEGGQALLLLVGVLMAVCLGAAFLGALAHGLGTRNDHQAAADLAALAAARVLHDSFPRVFEPPSVGGAVNASHLERGELEARAQRAAVAVARRNGAREVAVSFPGGRNALAPTRVRVEVADALDALGRPVADRVVAEAEVTPPGTVGLGGDPADPGGYPGPFAYRDGKPMRPDVAMAYDRMAAAARQEAGLDLLVVSGYRSDAEQAALYAAHPDPKWVAPPGHSLHRLGTELDLGPAAAYGWLDANAHRFHFTRRYAWEAWHFGYTGSPGSARVGFVADGRMAVPSFVPARYAPAIASASQRWSVGADLLAAQLYVESGFNPFARSPVGALGIAQFMPGTATAYRLRNPFDARAAIDAQAHLMRDLLREHGSVPLALAAYNAGSRRVSACGCIPPIPETQAYVAEILGLLHGAGSAAGAGAMALEVRLVR